MLTETQRHKIVNSFRLVVPIAETAAELFYARLFELRPEYRALFPEDMSGQRKKLVKMLAFVVRSLDFLDADWRARVEESDDLFLVILALGRRHSELYRVPNDSYGPVGEALLWTLDQGLGEAFTPDVKEAWTAIYTALATTMKLGTRSVGPAVAGVAT
jgi:hemoglobin-like flavoprotein